VTVDLGLDASQGAFPEDLIGHRPIAQDLLKNRDVSRSWWTFALLQRLCDNDATMKRGEEASVSGRISTFASLKRPKNRVP
jgi:hypothetical protein